jgi:REP element-mobilizing transposase RayT
MARGNRKSTLFHDDEDCHRFLQTVDGAVASYQLRVLAICLMVNHYHLVLETPRSNLSDAMQYVNGVFAQRSNRRYGQTGHVFEARFRSLIIQRESYLLRATRYVVRNPVRAGLVSDPGAWPWSSYRATAGLEPTPRWLDVEWIREAFSVDSLVVARQRYVDFVTGSPRGIRTVNLNEIVLGTKRYSSRVLGAGRADKKDPRPAGSRARVRLSLDELFDNPHQSLESRDRLIYTARVDYGYRFADIGRFLGIHRSTVSKAARRCEQTIAER